MSKNNKNDTPMVVRHSVKQLGAGKTLILGIQHTFTMFGATVLVPLLTGLNVSVALFMAGLATLFFHFVTKRKMPVFLGSSFAFIPAIISVGNSEGLAYARGGIVIAGLIYLVVALLVYLFGVEKILNFFPPVVTGSIIMSIGLTLAGTAITNASQHWGVAVITFLAVMIISIYAKGFLKLVPVLGGLVVGFVAALVFGIVDFTPVAEASWFGVPPFELPKFSISSIIAIAPVAIATVVEHFGDVIAISETCGEDYTKDPGVHRTLIGDGVGTSISALVGGPANTTYSENTGVLALTKVFDPVVMRIAAIFAIILGLVPKLGAIIGIIPSAVIGGMSIIVFGMIASIGSRTFVDNGVDFSAGRNQIILSAIMVLSLGGDAVPGGMATAAILGIVLNKILPEAKPIDRSAKPEGIIEELEELHEDLD